MPYSDGGVRGLLIAASYLIGQLTAGQDMKIIKDLGLAALSIFGLLIAVFIGIGLVSKEVEKKSIYGLLSKPVSRAQFILGKYAGLVMTLAVNLASMTVALLRGAVYMDAGTPRRRWRGRRRRRSAAADRDRLIFAELMLVTALALFFSTYSSPLLATLLTLGLWVAGHFNADLRNFENVVDSRRRRGWRGRSITSCPIWRRSTSRLKWCTACRSRCARRSHAGLRGGLYHTLLIGGGRDFPAPRFQVRSS